MRFFIQHEAQKKLLTAENYSELRSHVCEMFGLSAEKIELLYLDPTDNSEISISNQNDFKEILTEIEELKSKGNTSKPLIRVNKQQNVENVDELSAASTVRIDPMRESARSGE